MGKTQVVGQPLPGNSSVGTPANQAGEDAAGPDDGVQQAASGAAVAELQPVGEQKLHSQVVRQRAHDVVEPLADQHHRAVGSVAGGVGGQDFLELLHSTPLEARLEDIVKVLFAQEVEAVAADAAQ